MSDLPPPQPTTIRRSPLCVNLNGRHGILPAITQEYELHPHEREYTPGGYTLSNVIVSALCGFLVGLGFVLSAMIYAQVHTS